MELFLWLWLWDKRTLCNLRHPLSPHLLSNLWLIPLALNIALLVIQDRLVGEPAFTTWGQTGESVGMAKRLASLYNGGCAEQWRGVEDLREIYFVALCIQVIILIVVIALSNWQARKTGQARLGVELKHFSNVETYSDGKNGGSYHALESVRKFVHRDFWHRHSVVCSLPGLSLLAVSLFIYFWSWRYLAFYNSLIDSCGDLYGEQIAKTSAFYVMLYCWLFLVILDSPVVGWFLLCFLLKTVSVLSYVLCPLKQLAFQKEMSQRHGFCWLQKRKRAWSTGGVLRTLDDASDDDELYS